MSRDPIQLLAGRVSINRIRTARAFTLLELLVVVGLIALLAAGFGIALGDTGGNALASAQTTVATMVGSARAQAAVHQTEAVLAIYGTRPPTGDPEKYLRLLQVFRNSTPGAARPTWVAAGSPATLPRGVYVVPPSTAGLLASGVTWPSNPPRVSTLRGPIALAQPAGTPFGTGATAFVVEFAADGTIAQIGALPHSRLVVATAARVNNLPQFNNNAAARGLILRPSGAVTFVNQAIGF
jgi:prepilin-type N-terminal cleavage/methylation domain-containing protein